MPITRFGLSVDLPSAVRRCCQRRLSARPPSIAASLEPVVEQPVASSAAGAFQRLARMLTQRISISAVCGYSSLSIMFLSKHSAMSFSACGSIHVDTNVATFRRALPSSMSSSWMIWYATSGGISPSGSSCRGMVRVSRLKWGATAMSAVSFLDVFGCVSVTTPPSVWSVEYPPSGRSRVRVHPGERACVSSEGFPTLGRTRQE